MHILYVHQHFTTPEIGGGTRSYEFARRFAERGHEVTVIAGRPLDLDAVHSGLPDGVRVMTTATPYRNRMGPGRRILSFLGFALGAIRLGWGSRPDVVYATSTPLTVAIPGLVLARRHHVPLVFEVRDLWPEAPIQMGVINNALLSRALRAFERYVYRRSAHVIALSPGMAEGVRAARTPPEKISMIPNSSDLDLFRPGPLDAAFLKAREIPRRPTIAYAGALGDANDVDALADAALELDRRGANLQLVVAGEGKKLPMLRDLARDHDLGTLVLLGRISKAEVAALYRASVAGLVLFSDVPILRTNSPNKFFDLLAAGRPVITNMRGWVADLVTEHGIGYAVEPGDGDALAEAIVAAAWNEEFEAMGCRARELAESEFARDDLAERVEAVLEDVARGNGAVVGRRAVTG